MDQAISLVCRQCGKAFAFGAEEKTMYECYEFANMPERCPVCRGAKRAIDEAVKPKRLMYSVICASCGKETQVPFQPKGDKPVYCQSCFAAQRNAN